MKVSSKTIFFGIYELLSGMGIKVGGSVNLANEQMNFVIRPETKGLRIFSLREALVPPPGQFAAPADASATKVSLTFRSRSDVLVGAGVGLGEGDGLGDGGRRPLCPRRCDDQRQCRRRHPWPACLPAFR